MTSYPISSPDEEQVVLLDEAGRAIGAAPKRLVHNAETPLHLAFSCYLFDGDDRLLVTRRAWSKVTWPGVWTNTVCGHPGVDESIHSAVRRRAAAELGLGLGELRIVLPAFRYRAEMANGVVENEMCPVFVAATADQPEPEPSEVAETQWVPWQDFAGDVLAGRRDVSPWCADQVRQLAVLGTEPRDWPAAPTSALPVAAREPRP
jgi:isopentenyl-diphosphate delta-isomerase